jgi:phosphoribosylformylglycinamidine (FGAM) synthase-like amidotransferase family enzyme
MGSYSANAHMAAISDQEGRVMVLMTHNTDISDSWEREGQNPEYFLSFSPQGYAVGLNVALYAMMR